MSEIAELHRERIQRYLDLLGFRPRGVLPESTVRSHVARVMELLSEFDEDGISLSD